MSEDFFPPCPHPFDELPSEAVRGPVEVTDGEIEFTPVPRLRRRRNGWTAETQRAFIAALGQCGCVARAARAVGMTSRSAYRLLEADGADSFAEAWDQAIARGIDALREQAIDRALNGMWVPVMRKGKIVRMEHRYNDRLCIALLSGRESSVAENREQALSRRKYRLQIIRRREREVEAKRQADAIRAAHQAVVDRIEEEKNRPGPPPRIRRL